MVHTGDPKVAFAPIGLRGMAGADNGSRKLVEILLISTKSWSRVVPDGLGRKRKP
jgi:hypothetical protein